MTLLQQNRFDLLVSDLDLGGPIDGLDLVEAAKNAPHETKTIIMSGKLSAKKTVPADTEFIEKPVTSDKLAHIFQVEGRDSV